MIKFIKHIIPIWLLLSFSYLHAQELNQPHQKYIEDIIESLLKGEEEQIDANALFEDLYYFMENPLNLNAATYEDLLKLTLLNDFQIKSFLDYRKQYGQIVSTAELNYIFGFNEKTVELISPFVSLAPIIEKEELPRLSELKRGRSELVLRTERVLEEREGYRKDSTSNSEYLGSPMKVYTRYNYKLYEKLRFGIIAEKDPGEEFFKGSNKTGFDFYSLHLQYQGKGFLRKLCLGDYHMEAGQGLLLWSGYGFGKSSNQQSAQRTGRGLRLSNSADENRFFRGAGLTMGYKSVELSLFGSYKSIDATIINDSIKGESILGFYRSGLHNTSSSNEKENNIQEATLGASLEYKGNNLSIGLNAFYGQYNLPLSLSERLYQSFGLSGSAISGMSAHYRYLFPRFQLFGEIANSHHAWANLHGANLYLSSNISLVALYRNYQKAYFAPYNNAFAENSGVLNENGLYTGIDWRLSSKIYLIAYLDIFEFPWLKYQVNGPSKGKEYLLETGYTLSGNINFYARYKAESKGKNYYSEGDKMNTLKNFDSHQLRFHISYQIGPSLKMKNRLEWRNTGYENETNENGYVAYQDVDYTMKKIPVQLSFRYAWFNTDSYNCRIYAYERDLRYVFSTPSYYGQGNRIYFLVRYNAARWLQVYARISSTKFNDREIIGSGLNEINGSRKSDVKLQCIVKF